MANGTTLPSPPSLSERIRGKRTRDIRLPMEAGSERDPRLGVPSNFEKLREGLERLQSMGRSGAKRNGKRNGKRAVARR